MKCGGIRWNSPFEGAQRPANECEAGRRGMCRGDVHLCLEAYLLIEKNIPRPCWRSGIPFKGQGCRGSRLVASSKVGKPTPASWRTLSPPRRGLFIFDLRLQQNPSNFM